MGLPAGEPLTPDERQKIVIKYGTDDPWELIQKILEELAGQQLLYGNLATSLQRSGVTTIPLGGAPIPEIKDAISQSKWLGFDQDSPEAYGPNQ